ncbi:MAG TPA: acyl-CoA reductase [Clostridiales bacterium]|nr:acyl-CoA reductase [Clostridiales bacterium]
MILFDGQLFESSEQGRLLAELKEKIPQTLQTKSLDPEIVVDAVDQLRKETLEGKFDDLLTSFPKDIVESYKKQAEVLLSKEYLHLKIRTELGNTEEYVTDKLEGFSRIRVKKVPLGVIFHIAAGNMDFLPAYSLAEGLLAGNINILKLPSADNGLSLKLIMQLIEYQPELKDFIYVFDTSSTDIQGMRTMAELSNGISVWGSDMAIEAVRGLAPTGAKLIEWGQKLGFCYISDPEHAGNIEQDLEGLAKHIAFTKQLLCSSCQVIYLDTKDMQEVRKFAERFFPILQKAVDANASDEIGIRARDTLVAYTQRLKRYLGEEEKSADTIRGRGMSLILSSDSDLELSPMMCNVLVKPLPKEKITEVLFASRYYLQTVGLICPMEKREELVEIFAKCGLTRITTGSDMSTFFPGESHDGEYALDRYMKVINIEVPSSPDQDE